MPAHHLSPMLRTLLETGGWSDLVIKCRGKEWKVHRFIVCPVSKPLAAALKHSFKESLSGEFTFEDEDSNTVGRFIKFLYSGDYCDNATIATARGATQTITGVSEALLTNTKVYVMAEKYDVLALKEHAVKKFTLALPKEGMTASFLSSLKLMYEETPDSDQLLRSAAMKFIGENYKDLVKNAKFVELCTAHRKSWFFDTIKVVAEFAAREHEPKKCPNCHSTKNTRTCTVSEKENNFYRAYYCDEWSCMRSFD
jgi:hypothetical protein